MQYIEIFPWQEQLNTGDPLLDSQHQKLASMLNRAALEFTEEPESFDLHGFFDTFLSYADRHFEQEEGLWKEYLGNSECLTEHKKDHERFAKTCHKILDESNDTDLQNLTETSFVSLVQWITHHILESDPYILTIANQVQRGLSLEKGRAIADHEKEMTQELIKITVATNAMHAKKTLELMLRISQKNAIESKLRANEQLLRTVVDELSDILILKDENGNFLLGNKKIAQLYNTTPDALIGKDDSSFGVPKEMSDFFRQNVLNIMKSGKTEIVYEESRDTLSGEIHYFKSVKKPFKNSEGKDSILIIAHDMTEEMRIRNELQQQRSFFKTLVDTIPYLVFLKDLDGTFLACNRRMESALGVKAEEIIGKNSDDFLNKEVSDSFRRDDLKVINTGLPLVSEEWIVFHEETQRRLLKITKTPMYDEEKKLIGVLGIAHDITEERQSEERLAYALHGANDGLWDWNMENNEVYYSPRWCEMLGYNEDELPQTFETWTSLVHPDDQARTMKHISDHLEGKTDNLKIEIQMRHKNGKWVHVLSRAKMPKDENGNPKKPQRLVGTHVDITERWEHQQQLHHIAHYDSLTGLPNRLRLSQYIQQSIEAAKENQTMMAVIYLDLDGFKNINDHFGHEVGDKLLVALSKRMIQFIKKKDHLSRLGGDEFIIILQDLFDIESAKSVMERILKAIAAPVNIGEFELSISGSMGAAFFASGDYHDPDQLIRQSDQAMYQAKQLGKNRYHIFDAAQDKDIRARHESVERIQKALVEKEFVLYYQPKVNMRTGAITGVEALIRWEHPQEGLLSPISFLPVIENRSILIEIGDWVFETIAQQITQWRQEDIFLPISVNVDAIQLQQNDFVDKLKNLLKRYPAIEHGDIEIEVLETSALKDVVHVSFIINECKKIGISFTLDDFGTGYSSLTYLKRIPATSLKIDRTFVRDLLIDHEDLAIIQGVLKLSETFKLHVVAEGVESVLQGAILLLLGCEHAQGYIISKPMKAEHVATWCRDWKAPDIWIGKKPLLDEHADLLHGIIDNFFWTRSISDYLFGSSTKNPLSTINECKLNQWLTQKGKAHIEPSSLADIFGYHAKIHQIACKILDDHQQDRKSYLTSDLELIEKIRDLCIHLVLDSIKDSVFQK